MAASSKEELIAITEKEFSKLKAALEDVDEALATTPHPDDKITIKDTVLHRVHWVNLFFGWYEDGLAGKDVVTPAPGYKWNQLKEYNAKIREKSQTVSWKAARQRLDRAHKKLLTFMQDLSDKQLYAPPSQSWMNKWTLGRWAEASGPSHYRSAAKYIREIKRKTG